MANKTLFDAAGVPLPDDETWTWDDYIDTAAQISQNSPDGVYGAAPLGMDAISFQAFLRQKDAAAYSADGQVDFDADDFVSYLELADKLRDSGGSGGPEVASEQTALPLEQTGTSLNTFGMGFWASGQFTALANNSQQELIPLRLPALKSGANAWRSVCLSTGARRLVRSTPPKRRCSSTSSRTTRRRPRRWVSCAERPQLGERYGTGRHAVRSGLDHHRVRHGGRSRCGHRPASPDRFRFLPGRLPPLRRGVLVRPSERAAGVGRVRDGGRVAVSVIRRRRGRRLPPAPSSCPHHDPEETVTRTYCNPVLDADWPDLDVAEW